MKPQSAFTPLRIALFIFIILVNIMALIAFFYADASWSKIVGILATVFILMLVFLQILELIWLVSFKKHQDSNATIKSYQLAIKIHLTLFPIGFFMVYLVLG